MQPRYRIREPRLLAMARVTAGVTQMRLADYLRVTRSAVTHWESGRNIYILEENARRIAELLDTRFDMLFTTDGRDEWERYVDRAG